MVSENIEQLFEKEFLKFKTKYGDNILNNLSEFFNDFRKVFENEKNREYKQQGSTTEKANQKTRQSWAAFLGGALEKVIFLSIEEFCKKNGLKIATDKVLDSNNLDKKLDLVKRALLVHFDKYSFLPDADLVIYTPTKDNVKIYCILSIKNSFRERYTETPYWKLKLLQNENTKNIKVFMLTPDNDDEISFIKNDKPRKARIVMEYELDGIYLGRNEFIGSNKIKDLNELKKDILELVKNEK